MTDAWIPEPSLIFLGCQPWPPRRLHDRRCQVCGDGIRSEDPSCYCAVCDSMAPSVEERVRSARHGVECREKSRTATEKLKSSLRRKANVVLSEAHRRQIANGYKGSLIEELAEVNNTAKAGRDWLRSIGQLPDWRLPLKVHDRENPPFR